MKGFDFNPLDEVVTIAPGQHAWADPIDAACADGDYTARGSALFDTRAAALEQSPDNVLRRFGRSATPLLATRFDRAFTNHSTRWSS